MIHKVRNPLMCRHNQFGNGQELIVGIDLKTLTEEKTHRMTIGKNPKVYYIDTDFALSYSMEWNSKYLSKISGKQVCMLPVRIFKIEGEVDDNTEVVRETKPKEVVQETGKKDSQKTLW